jgi:3-oxoacyl-[acyl-carrier-protein] synthase II
MSMNHRVVITGVGLILPLGDSSGALFAALCDGGGGVSRLPEFSPNGYKCHLASRLPDFHAEKYLSGRPLRPLDRASQLATAACGLALEDSGWSSAARAGTDLSLVVGTMFSGMHTIAEFDRTALTSGPASVSPMAFANTVINAAAGQAAIWHNLRGINSTVAAGSVSGLWAVGYSADLVRQGRSEALLAGGVDEFSLESFTGFDRAGSLCTNGISPECPVPFDRRRNGFALGEGAAFLMMEDLGSAKTRGAKVLAEVKGCASAFDHSQGRDSTLAVCTLARAMNSALSRSGIKPTDIDFVSASANGSIFLDNSELSALGLVFGKRAVELSVTAIKSAIGEALGASGPTQLAAAIKTFQTGRLPGVCGLRELPPECRMRGIRAETVETPATNALINAAGFDGHCLSMVLSSFGN